MFICTQEPDIKELSGDKLKENIVKFGLGDLNPEAAAGSLELLKSYRFEDVKEINYTAACLYAWVRCKRFYSFTSHKANFWLFFFRWTKSKGFYMCNVVIKSFGMYLLRYQ